MTDMTKDNLTVISGSILAGALIVAGSIIYAFGPDGATPNVVTTTTNTLPAFETKVPYQQTLGEGGDIILGNPGAKVKIVEYGDYQCPYCEKFFKESEGEIRRQYVANGKANMIYKDLIVIDNFIPNGQESHNAALAANCAADQGKFWEYHDALFTVEGLDGKENNGNLIKSLFMTIAEKLKLDKKQFENCYDTGKYSSEVISDTAEASKDLARLSTPSTLINGEVISGAVPFSDFAAVIDKYLK